MYKIIKLDKKHMEQLAGIDLESNSQRESDLKLSDYRKMLKKKVDDNYELFFGLKENNILKGCVPLKPFFPRDNNCEVSWLLARNKFQV